MAERSSIVPEGESVRRALRWLSEQRQTDPAAPSAALVEEAAVRFDLTPLQGGSSCKGGRCTRGMAIPQGRSRKRFAPRNDDVLIARTSWRGL